MFTSFVAATLVGKITFKGKPSTPRTERDETLEQLYVRAEQFRSAFEYAPIGMALSAPDGRWLMVNRALQDLVGYTEKELQATTFQNITHPDDLAADLNKRQQLLAGNIPYFMMEKRYVHKHGHAVWILLCVSLIRDSAGKPLHFLVQVQDITSRKQAETAIQVRDEFLSVAAHELKTPITALQGVAQGTVRHIDQAGDSGVLDLKHVRRALQAIDQQAHKLTPLA